MKVTGDIQERAEQLARLELVGIKKPSLSFGPPALLWTKTREAGLETWEILPEWIAELVVSEMHCEPDIARAILFRRLPRRAPPNIAIEWYKVHHGGRHPFLPDFSKAVIAA